MEKEVKKAQDGDERFAGETYSTVAIKTIYSKLAKLAGTSNNAKFLISMYLLYKEFLIKYGEITSNKVDKDPKVISDAVAAVVVKNVESKKLKVEDIEKASAYGVDILNEFIYNLENGIKPDPDVEIMVMLGTKLMGDLESVNMLHFEPIATPIMFGILKEYKNITDAVKILRGQETSFAKKNENDNEMYR
ncbi:MAG: hypothetical protein LVQ97_03675 [Candidatus Micrarchaeales archaeon]|jgi:hypothetical protein|uniref:Uncharacterized protein n=1 Tax=Candidatus Micrarchaeum acidiphilum ARMAN-2 TaxID=425595 RepID=C7DGI9_MICA2|nr:MAG: hypothetical protein UNLARM2_0191 [Candidatus Micrarchaeum acidiphilum ARMAN-2]MCW6161257.1 hypothetical protein [Candidatus Micrarchaeales archaeon]